mgnify:CR=1 FL=1
MGKKYTYQLDKLFPRLSSYGEGDLDRRFRGWSARWKRESSYSIERMDEGVLLIVTIEAEKFLSYTELLKAKKAVNRIIDRISKKWCRKKVWHTGRMIKS